MTRTTRSAPLVVRATSVAMSDSRWVTRPIKYTVPRSLTTLNELVEISLISTKPAFTRPVNKESLALSPNEGLLVIASSL